MAEFGHEQAAALSKPRRVQVTESDHVYVRTLTAGELGDVLEAESLPEDERIARYLAIFLGNEDGGRRFPAPTEDDLALLAAWPARVTTAIINAATELNGLQADHAGN